MTRSAHRQSSGGSEQGHPEGRGPGLRFLSVPFLRSRQLFLTELKHTSLQLPQEAWFHLPWRILNFQTLDRARPSHPCPSPVASGFLSCSPSELISSLSAFKLFPFRYGQKVRSSLRVCGQNKKESSRHGLIEDHLMALETLYTKAGYKAGRVAQECEL